MCKGNLKMFHKPILLWAIHKKAPKTITKTTTILPLFNNKFLNFKDKQVILNKYHKTNQHNKIWLKWWNKSNNFLLKNLINENWTNKILSQNSSKTEMLIEFICQ